MTLTLDTDLVNDLRNWCAGEEVPPPFGRAIDLAMREFLESRGALAEQIEARLRAEADRGAENDVPG
ncbi:MAG: hypothetical protein AAFQ51_12220 [Pseudomonadota bacterium]